MTDEFSIVIGYNTAVLKSPVRAAKSRCLRHLKRKGQNSLAINRPDPNESTDWYHRFYHGEGARSTECNKWPVSCSHCHTVGFAADTARAEGMRFEQRLIAPTPQRMCYTTELREAGTGTTEFRCMFEAGSAKVLCHLC